MKKFIIALILIGASTHLTGQKIGLKGEIEKAIMKSGLDSSLITELLKKNANIFKILDSIKENPDEYNKTWTKLMQKLDQKDSAMGYWLNSLNLDFKTFQSKDSSLVSLGLSYDLNLEKGKIYQSHEGKNGVSGSLGSKGNIAFNKKINPADFLDSKVMLKFYHASGGIQLPLNSDSIHKRILTLLPVLMAYSNITQVKKSHEWNDLDQMFRLKNSYLYSLDVNFGIESNQDFSKSQYIFGTNFGFSAKSWDKANLLSKLNIFDYPFVLTRFISGVDRKFGPNGVSIPELLLGLDYVIPQNDSIRIKDDPDLKPYFRLKFEVGFRSLVVRAAKQIIYFNVAYKFFNELNASPEIKDANLSKFKYFVMSLSSDKGFFVSYSYGRLPFDRQNDAVYQMGFSYKF